MSFLRGDGAEDVRLAKSNSASLLDDRARQLYRWLGRIDEYIGCYRGIF